MDDIEDVLQRAQHAANRRETAHQAGDEYGEAHAQRELAAIDRECRQLNTGD